MLKKSAISILCTVALAAAEKTDKPDPAEFFRAEIQPILKSHCIDCHGNDNVKGDLNLEYFDELDKVKGEPERWQAVLERVQAFEMPPEGKKELDFNRHQKLMGWLRDLPKPEQVDCDQIASDRNASFYRGYVMSRRLNRAEYSNTIRDLFGVEVQLGELLPADGGGGEGFDTAGNALFTSSIHIEKYMAAADLVLNTVLPDSTKGLSKNRREARSRVLLDEPKPSKTEAREMARDVVSRVARRAYRRPVDPAEIDRTMTMFDRAWDRGDGYLPSLRLALKSVLISPHFLFLVEPESVEKGVQPLGPLPAASRLSYFLWSSMPDEELLDLAASGKLLEPDVYQQQIRRMLADPKAGALGERFALQWLGFERLGTEVKPDPQQFPEFDPELQSAMLAEVAAVFNYIVQADRPLTDLIDADYTFVNERLARLYGVESIEGSEFQKVSLTDRRRGGVAGTAAAAAVTSFPLRTSPVLRGKWVLESLLGERVNPPPPGTPTLEETANKAKDLTLREQLELHRASAECAACHDKMDPLGFGMENFDVLGRWRELDQGKPVDARGTLPGGESFTGPAGLKTILMSRKEAVIRHLVKKMTGYAYGRELNKFDDCVVKKAMEALEQSDYRPSVLIEQIATSFPFLHRFYPNFETNLETNQ